MKSPSRITILNRIFGHFQGATQWLPSNPSTTARNLAQAEGLIEMLEAHDCGHVGGFDPKNRLLNTTKFPLYNRFLTLVRKYNDENNIKKCCHFDLVNLGKYFNKLTDLRNFFNK